MEYLHELFSGDDTSELIFLDLTAFVIEKIATNRERNKTSSSSVKRQTKSSFLQTSKDVSCMAPLVLGNGVFWTVLQISNSRWIWPIELKEQIVFVFYKRDLGKGYLDFTEFETYSFIRRLFVFLTRQVQLNHLFKNLSIDKLQSTSLTMLHEYQELDPSSPLKVDPMELYSYKLRLKWKWSFLVTLLMFRGTWATQRMHSSPVKTVVYRRARFK